MPSPAAADLGPCSTAAPTTRDVHLFVSDLDRAARWYRDKVGLTELTRWADQTFGGATLVSMQRGLAGVTLVSSPRELIGFRDPQMACFVLDGPPAPAAGTEPLFLADPDGTSVELPPAPARPSAAQHHIQEENGQQLKLIEPPKNLRGPGRASRNEDLAFCSKAGHADHQNDGPVAMDIGPRTTAPIGHVRPTPVIELIVSPGAESVQPAAAASGTQPSPALSDAKFRFGFLEFEDDVDAAQMTAGTATTVPAKRQ
ncbi:MAG TPA: VOC family protein [Hyphomicrobiaceae bacterium]|nr:VOC family protein [Hyphomicrobiaceae bacterium]